MKEFEESDAINYIKGHVEAARNYADDDILLLIDTVFEYDESQPDDAPDECFEAERVAEYVARQLKRDADCAISAEHVLDMVRAEQAYEDTLWEEE
ncbi:MAG: hypothetical protein J6I72_01160 [Muribaculaceae bacterium]|nr:hypothetical protein [Muribaculaceae bacterium]